MSILTELLEDQTLNLELNETLTINIKQHRVAKGLVTLSECDF